MQTSIVLPFTSPSVLEYIARPNFTPLASVSSLQLMAARRMKTSSRLFKGSNVTPVTPGDGGRRPDYSRAYDRHIGGQMGSNADSLLSRANAWFLSFAGLDDEIENLRTQFYVTLRAYLARIEASRPEDSAALDRVRALLATDRRPRWSECYEVEQLMVHLFDEQTLSTELEVRLLEAKSALRKTVWEYYEREALAVAGSTERRRALLARLVNDLQWRYTVQEGKRRFAKSLTTRTGIVFVIALSAFTSLATYAHVHGWEFSVGDWRLLFAAAVSGMWGAAFSMLTGLQQRIRDSAIYDLNLTRALTMLVARALLGAGAACVLYVFFASGMMTGAMFPKLVDSQGFLSRQTMSLLVIWCFVAGFSEKLVSNLLSKTEAKVNEHVESVAAVGREGRYRPTEHGVGAALATERLSGPEHT